MQWEYRVLTIGYIENAEGELNRLGAEGWELVSIAKASFDVAVFKRPKLAGDLSGGR